MSLFGGLPAPSKRPADQHADARSNKAPKLAGAAAGAAAAAAAAPPELEDLEDLEDEAPEAEPQPAGDYGQQQEVDEADVPPPPPPPPPPGSRGPGETAGTGGGAAGTGGGTAGASGDDQVAAALRKIAAHIGSPKKFAKASQLLRELLSQGAVRQAHGPLLFSALKAAMADPSHAADPLFSREYNKLFTTASRVAEVFTVRERSQLDVYGTWAVLRSQLATDDSFQFNRVVGQLKEMAAELPEAEEGDEQVVQQLAAAAGAPDPVLAAYDARQQQQQAAAAAPAPAQAAAADAEADPFGLDALLEQQEAEAEAARQRAKQQQQQQQVKSSTWTSGEAVCQRRAALLDCLDAAKACYRHAWARTSVDLLVEHCNSHKHRFAPSQAQRIDALMAFVRDQRRLRKLGPSAKEVNRDSTSFERARAEWSKSTVSHRGKVGGGDRQSETWLG